MAASKVSASSNSSKARQSRGNSADAAVKAIRSHDTAVTIPAAGTLHLPSKSTLAYFAGIGALAALGIIEWPVAAVVAIGHLLAQQHGNAALEEFGQGLTDA